jgi:HPt (histidine-containing phosphotransfer) domain-containing protein
MNISKTRCTHVPDMDFKFIKTDYLDMVASGDTGLIRELVDIFTSQVGEFHSQMVSLFEQKDYNELGLLAHKAKSSVAIMGMDDLADMLKTFELKARNGEDPELYEAYISRFANDTKCALAELDALINK